MSIECVFEDKKFLSGKNFYTCVVRNQEIPDNTELKLIRCHGHQEIINLEVYAIVFKDCQITKVPQGLTKIFPNLKILSIWRSNLETVTKADLAEYKKMEKIGFCNNEIEFVPGDLFEGFENLNEIGMYGNRAKIIEPNILDGLDKLEHVDFRDNIRYKKCHSRHAHQSNGTLEDVKDEIFIRYYKDHKNILKIEEENKILKNSNDFLNQRVQRLENEIREMKHKVDRSEKVQKIFNIQNKLEGIKIASPVVKKQKPPLKIPTNIVADLKNLLQVDEYFKDLKIVIEDHEFPVHKILIAGRSPTLAEILKNNPEVENLNLVDISKETFEIILKFLYTDELPADKGINFMQLFTAAGKLKIEELKDFAGMRLINQVNEENALDVFKMSSTYGGDDLRQRAFEEVKKKYPKITFEDEWSMDVDTVMRIIQAFKAKEDAIRKAEEEFECLIKQSKYSI